MTTSDDAKVIGDLQSALAVLPVDNARSIEARSIIAATIATLQSRASTREEALEEAAAVADNWIVSYGEARPIHITAQDWANDAVRDVADAIRSLKSSPRTSDGR